MKRTLFLLFSLIAYTAQAAPLNSGSNVTEYSPGAYGTIADSTPTFALNSVTPTVDSSAIDLSSTGAIVVCVSATAGTSPIVQVQYANLTYAAFTSGVYNIGAGCWPVRNSGRYVKFHNAGTSLTAKTSLNYYVLSPPSVSIGNSITVAGVATAANQTTEINSLSAINSDTTAIRSSSTGSAGSLTVIAAVYDYPNSDYVYGGAGQPTSNTVRTISTAVTQIQITRTAGSNQPTNVYLGATPTAGTIIYSFTNNGTTPTSDAFYWPYTNGTTPITPQPAVGPTILWLKTVTGTYDVHLEFWQ